MKTIKMILLYSGLSLYSQLTAQVLEPRDGIYDKVHTPTRHDTKYATLREADASWYRRMWRTIDLREKMNQFMYYPLVPTNGRKNLITIIMNAIINDKVVAAYDPLYDDFKVKLTASQVEAIGRDSIHTTIESPFPPYLPIDTVLEAR